MRITLLSPYKNIGIRLLSACLEREGHEVQIIILPNHFTKRYSDTVLRQLVGLCGKSDLIGISLMTNYFDNVVQITQAIKEKLTAPVIWGGVHPTIRPEECLVHADMICVGEGEAAMVQLASRMSAGRPYTDTAGLWFRKDGGIIRNPVQPLLQDLDSIPFQDYEDGADYLLDGDVIRKMDLQESIGRTYTTLATRGCPFGCTYCVNNILNGMYPNQKKTRKRSIDNLIRELVEIRSRAPFLKLIKFDDDAFFTYSMAEIEDFCRKYKENIGLPFEVTGATPTTLTREKLAVMVDAGLLKIRMGIQTASERTKKLYKRVYTNEQVEKSANIINEFKDKVRQIQFDIILDNPWETDQDLTDTLMFLAKLPPPYNLSLFSLTFYPETELYFRARKDGIIKDDHRDVYSKYFHGWKKTYMNRLFYMLHNYSKRGCGINPAVMSLLTNKTVRYSGANWLLYGALCAFYPLVKARWKLSEGRRVR